METTTGAPSRMHAVARYGLAIILVTLALAVSLALRNSLGNPFWFFFGCGDPEHLVRAHWPWVACRRVQHDRGDVLLHTASA